MKYQFPYLSHIDDVLPAIEGRQDFVVADKGDYTVINYAVSLPDTFPEIPQLTGSHSWDTEVDKMNHYFACVRRECRGLIFDRSGNLIRRPYQKFFNLNERSETQDQVISLADPHGILEKLDGSLIVPFKLDGAFHFGTKMGKTDVSMPVQEFVLQNFNYMDFAATQKALGYNPIFEWCSKKQKIVLNYPEDQLILTAIRHINTGEYVSHDQLVELGRVWNIPVVKRFDGLSESIHHFVTHTRGLVDQEGYVVRYTNGHMFKVKSDWYVQIHKAKEKILFDRHIVEMILDNTLDDVKAHLDAEERQKLEEFELDIQDALNDSVTLVYDLTHKFTVELGLDKKTFALEHAPDLNPMVKALIFTLWIDNSMETAYTAVVNLIKKNLSSNVKYDVVRDLFFDGVKFN